MAPLIGIKRTCHTKAMQIWWREQRHDVNPHKPYSPAPLRYPTCQNLHQFHREVAVCLHGIYASVLISKIPNRALALLIMCKSFALSQLSFEASLGMHTTTNFENGRGKKNKGQLGLDNTTCNCLYLDKFTGLAQGSCFMSGSADHLAKDCPLLNHPNCSFVCFFSVMVLDLGSFKIGYESPCFELQPVISANHPEIIKSNLLDKVLQGHTARPLNNPPFENFLICPIEA